MLDANKENSGAVQLSLCYYSFYKVGSKMFGHTDMGFFVKGAVLFVTRLVGCYVSNSDYG